MIQLKIFPELKTKTLFLLLLIFTCSVNAQSFKDGGSYMNYMGEQYKQITQDFLSYTSAVAHGKSARKCENRRKSLIQTVKDATKKIGSMHAYQGDKSLRDSASSYLKLSFHILNDDYGKIVNMEEVAEQSYDAMEAYLLAQELANEKLDRASERLILTEKAFAASHKVNLIEKKSDLAEKAEKAGRVNSYHRKIYLIFFKSYKQEVYLLDAIKNKNFSAIEQSKNSLISFSEEGLRKLDTIKAFSGDNSLINACRQILEFYKNEGKDKIPSFTAFYMKEDNYQKIKKAFDAKRESERTKADVDQFNKAVNEMNAGVNEFNNINNSLNVARNKHIEGWNKASQGFLDKHVPHYK